MSDWLAKAAKRSGWLLADEASQFLDAGGMIDAGAWGKLSMESKAALVAANMQREAARAMLHGMATTDDGIVAISDKIDGGDMRRQLAVERMATEVLNGRAGTSDGAEIPARLP